MPPLPNWNEVFPYPLLTKEVSEKVEWEAEEGLVEKGVPEWGFRIWNYLQEE